MAANENTLIDAGVHVGLLAAEAVPKLRLEAKRERLSLVEAVTRAGRFPEAALYRALADIRRLPFLQLDELKADSEVLAAVPRRVWQTRLMLPVRARDGSRLLAMADPDDRLSLERVERATGMTFQLALTDPETLKKAVADSRKADPSTAQEPVPIMEGAEPHDPVRLLDDIMKEAWLRRASDVHFEPQEDGMRIRLRVDGHLQEYPSTLSAADEEALVNRVKVLANLDIAEQRMAQDGAMKYAVTNWNTPETDIRVATIPTRWGERCTLRILGQETGQLSLGQLGMSGQMLERFRRAIGLPHGMILVTGPTGSGKSTTLYAAMRELPINELNVLTVEDPVEQTLAGITQVQVSGKVGFAQALRSFLRHDPDVILVGEVRDRETAEIGLRAAMTGHLVMSTLHTNDSVGAVTRLADIGVERYLIGSTLIGVLAQRLARRLCPHCRRKRPCKPEELRALNLPEDSGAEIFEPAGCSFCLGTGFLGRIGFFEALWINQDLRLAIAEGAGEREIRRLASDFTSLWQDCSQKVLDGDVALSDILHFRPEGGD
ncbi:GspE/PulE family protein [Termitidicoccus mucosus]|uniref:Secretion system protein E n=1 Tax=Termitidicoccus mucosus TaxID=1184151 RepID=A0A178INC6_9BACT|nr:secretion system protein E [Opitutaceae bacterium TSB47]